MAKQVGKVGGLLASKLGEKGRQAVLANREKEVAVGQTLPGGVSGVAELRSCTFGEFKEGKNKGALYFMARGIVQEPEAYKGMATQIGPHALIDTPSGGKMKTQEDHLNWAMDQMAALGADKESMSLDNLEEIAAALEQAKPMFRFRTWQGAKQDIAKDKDGKYYLFNLGENDTPDSRVAGKGPYSSEQLARAANPYAGREPMVNHLWNGTRGLENYHSPEPSSAVQDNTPEEPVAPAKPAAKPSPKPAPKPEPEPEEEESQAEETTSGAAFMEVSLDDLLELANAQDDDASSTLKDRAIAAGMTEEEVEGAESWGDVVAEIQKREGGEPEEETTEEEAEPEAEVEPIKGALYFYKVLDPKTKKPLTDPKTKKERKAVQVEIQAVDKKAKTASLLNDDDRKTLYKGVPWDQLMQTRG